MDRPGTGDQYLTESDGGDKTFSDTGALVGTGGEDEKTQGEASWGYKMTNVKAQSSNQIQSPNDKEANLKFSHLTLI